MTWDEIERLTQQVQQLPPVRQQTSLGQTKGVGGAGSLENPVCVG